MRIFTNRAFGFKNPNAPGQVNMDLNRMTEDKNFQKNFVRTEPGKFIEVPDWAAKDQTFKDGVRLGNIEVVESAKQEKIITREQSDKAAQKGRSKR